MPSANVVVAVRVRPLDSNEVVAGARYVVRATAGGIVLDTEKTFRFDHVFWSGDLAYAPEEEYASQEVVYKSIGRVMLDHAFEGFNTCIFAYGQTGAGKTYTMMGGDEDPGIIPRACEELFERISESMGSDGSFKVELSYFEIYNERVRCLLTSSDKAVTLRVREHPVSGPYVEGLTQVVVHSFDDVYKWLCIGNQARTVAATKHNQHSSRSHSVFTLILTQTKVDEAGQCTELISKINLVDLAGSERCGQTTVNPADSQLFKEGININKSLSTLGRVIHALSDRDAPAGTRDCSDATSECSDGAKKKTNWVAYRDSILTWLLKENLGGNSKTIMLANISPASISYDESLNTLRYADRVKYIKNDAVVNEDQNAKLIRELKEEISYLRQQLYTTARDPLVQSPGRRSSYSSPLPRSENEEEWQNKLEMSEHIISELKETWEERFRAAQAAFKERLQQTEREILSRATFAVGELPLLLSLNPHPVTGEQLAYPLRIGETYLGTDDESITEETRDDIRLSDGFNLSNPHCIFDHHDNGEVEIVPLNGSLSYINGQLLTVPTVITHGSRLVLGSNHVFLFVDPLQSKLFRQQRKADPAACPKIIDWAYASQEFATAMDIVCKPAHLAELQEANEAYRLERDGWRDAAELVTFQYDTYRHTPFLILSSALPSPDVRVMYHLKPGKNAIGFGAEIAPPGCSKELQVLEYNPTTGNVGLVIGTRTSVMPNASRFNSGECHFQLVYPTHDRCLALSQPATKSTRPPGAGIFHSPAIPPEVERQFAPPCGTYGEGMPMAMHPFLPPWEEALFFEDLKQQLYALQFQLFNIRDAMFPPPPDFPDDEEAAEAIRSAMSREELDNMERRRALRDEWILTSKKVDGRDVLEHMAFLQDELRLVSSTVTQWMYQLHSLHAERTDGEFHTQLAAQMEEKDKALAYLQAQVTLLHAECGQLRQENQRYAVSKSPQTPAQRREAEVPSPNSGAQIPAWSGRASDLEDDSRLRSGGKLPRLSKDVEELREKLMLTQTELEVSKEVSMQQEQEVQRLRERVRDRDSTIAMLEDRLKAGSNSMQAVPSSSELQRRTRLEEELASLKEHLHQKERESFELSKQLLAAHADKLTIERLRGEIKVLQEAAVRPGMEDERRKMEETKWKMKEVQQKLEVITAAHDALVESYNTLLRKQTHAYEHDFADLIDDLNPSARFSDMKRKTAHSPVTDHALSKENIKAFNKMKDTIKLLTKVAKSKDDKITKLEREMQSRDELMTSLNIKLQTVDQPGLVSDPSGVDAPVVADLSSVCVEHIQAMREAMDQTMQRLKAEVIQLTKPSLAILDKTVAVVAKIGPADVFKKALQVVTRVVLELIGEMHSSDEKWSLTTKEIEKLKPLHQTAVLRAFREMVISYEMISDYIKDGVICYEDLTRNSSLLCKIARFCVQQEKALSKKGSPSPCGERERPTSDLRCSSASSTRSSSTATGEQVVAPATEKLMRVPPTPPPRVPYVSPRRQMPTGTVTTSFQTSAIRNSSPRPGGTGTPSLSSAKLRTVSPRPATNPTPASTASKPPIALPTTRKHPSPDPAMVRLSMYSPRAMSPNNGVHTTAATATTASVRGSPYRALKKTMTGLAKPVEPRPAAPKTPLAAAK